MKREPRNPHGRTKRRELNPAALLGPKQPFTGARLLQAHDDARSGMKVVDLQRKYGISDREAEEIISFCDHMLSKARTS